MISVIISNPSITVKCAPCEASIVTPTKKACEKQSFSTCLFSFFFCQKQQFVPILF